MCSASRPERGGERDDGVKEVKEESAGWMIASMIRGDQEKGFKIGNLTSEGDISRTPDESPNNQKSKIWTLHRPKPVGDVHAVVDVVAATNVQRQ